MKKNILVSIAGVSLFSGMIGTATLGVKEVYATKVVSGKPAKVIHNSYIYNSKGKRIKKGIILKKNKTTKVVKIIKIKGKKYAQISKNQFIKLGNLSGLSKKSKIVKTKEVEETVIETSPSKPITPSELKDLGFIKDEDNPKLWVNEDSIGIKMTAKKDTVISVKDYGTNLSPIEKVTTTSSTSTGSFPGGSSTSIITKYESSPISDISYTIKFPKGSYVYWATPFSHIYIDPEKGIITYDGSNNYGLNEIDMFDAKYSINLNDVKLGDSVGKEISEKELEEYGNTTNVRILPRTGQFNTKDDSSIEFSELKKRNLLKDIYVTENESGDTDGDD